MFAGDHVLLVDGIEGIFPRLSGRLIDAMQAGHTMILQFELLASRRAGPAGFDGKAIVDLEAAGASKAICAMGQCLGLPPRSRSAGRSAAER